MTFLERKRQIKRKWKLIFGWNRKKRKWSAPKRKTNFGRLIVWWLDLTDPDPLRFYDRSTPLLQHEKTSVQEPDHEPCLGYSLTIIGSCVETWKPSFVVCLRFVKKDMIHSVVKVVLWSRVGGGSPDEARLEQTPYPITLYGFNQGGSYYSRGLKSEQGAEPPHFSHWIHCIIYEYRYTCMKQFACQPGGQPSRRPYTEVNQYTSSPLSELTTRPLLPSPSDNLSRVKLQQ